MMKKMISDNHIEMLQFSGLSGDCNIFHFVTTRNGGYSRPPYQSFNLSNYVEDDPEAVRKNREQLCSAMGITSNRLMVPYQVHGESIQPITGEFLQLSPGEQEHSIHGADGLITNVPGVCIAVTTADCVPVLLYDPVQKVIAVVHAGWRGTVRKIAAKAAGMMVVDYNSSPADIYAGIGPSICKEAFEVGEEVVEAFVRTGLDPERISSENPATGKAHIDLWEANRLQLVEAGLKPDHIEIAAICTYQYNDRFFSARREGIRSGRFLSGLLLR